jgi:hypothetical protein
MRLSRQRYNLTDYVEVDRIYLGNLRYFDAQSDFMIRNSE